MHIYIFIVYCTYMCVFQRVYRLVGRSTCTTRKPVALQESIEHPEPAEPVDVESLRLQVRDALGQASCPSSGKLES